MLRSVPCPFLQPIVVAGKVVNPSGTPSVSISKSNFTSVTDNSTGDFTLNLRTPFARAPLVFATPEVGVGAGGFTGITSSAVGAVRMVTRNSGGSAADGACHFFLLGSKQRATDYLNSGSNTLRSRRAETELLTFRVKGTGTAAIQSNAHFATLADNNTGDYTLTFLTPFVATAVIASINGTTAGRISVSSATGTAVNITTYNTSGSATDFDFNLWVFGYRTSYDGEVSGRSVKVPRLKPRFLFGQISVSGGTPTLSEGSGAFTIADGGAGIYDLTITKPFKQTPEVLVCADASKTANVASQSSSVIQVRTFSGASAADCVFTNFAVLGYDI